MTTARKIERQNEAKAMRSLKGHGWKSLKECVALTR